MKIALGKFGKSVVFGDIHKLRKSMTSGAIDAPTIYRALIEHNPQHEFYLIGRSDFSRMPEDQKRELNKHKNVIDPWENFTEWRKTYTGPEGEIGIRYLDLWRIEKNIELDAGIFLPGHMLPYGVQGKTISDKNDGTLTKCLVASYTYAGPMYHYVNMTKLPYVMLVTDPRCYPGHNKDLFVVPKRVLSQYNEELEVTHRIKYDSVELVTEKVDAVYSGIETLYLMQEPENNNLNQFFDDTFSEKRDIPMMLFLNEGNPSRYEDVMKYVLGENNQIKIYGKWNQKIYDRDSRFEDVPMVEKSHLFHRIKYTFCIPIKEGWCTGKFWDMNRMGIIPFVHPTYDAQRNIGFPEFLRIESAEDLQKKMDFLDNNEDEYNKLRNTLNSMITPDKKDGTYLSNTIMKHVEDIYEDTKI